VPAHSIEHLLGYVSNYIDTVNIDTFQIMNVDSTNIQPDHWIKIANTIHEKYTDYDGFVITHGTDTLAYTAAILSYMLQNSAKPIIVTGSQKPIEVEKTDATRNLADSICFACENAGGIFVVFNGSVINGCRAVKIRTKSANAFESINCPTVASIDGMNIRYNPEYSLQPAIGGLKFFPSIATNVILIKLMPGMKPDIFDYIKGAYRGVVIESFGCGGVPFIGDGNMLSRIEELTGSGVIVVITTQCLFEGGNLNLYESGRKISKIRVLPAYDMTTEAAVTKLMWALGQTTDFEAIRKIFLTPVNNDLAATGRQQEIC
jgi:L-asparaginase